MPSPILTRGASTRSPRGQRPVAARRPPRCCAEIMAGNASEAQIAAFLIALRTKGETVDELAGLAGTMRALATPVPCERDDLVDTAGTGGGRHDVQRLDHRGADRRRRRLRAWPSTATARRPGCRVAPTCSRRSARASTSRPTPWRAASTRPASASCSRPAHHAATRYVVPVRKELAVRTIFNFLGPLTNPAGARRQLIGVSDPAYLERMAGRAGAPGRRPGVGSVQRGWPRRDEHVRRRRTSSRSTATRIERYVVAPAGRRARAAAPPDAVAGGTPEDNAATTRAILAGEPGPRARPRAAQRRRRDLRRRPGRHARARASTPPARRSTRAPPRARTDAYLELSRRAGGPR